MATQNLNIEFNKENFNTFIEKLNDLTQLSDTIKINIDSENIFIYSVLGSKSIVLAMKTHILKTSEYLTKYDFEENLSCVILNAKKFVKNLAFIQTDSRIGARVSFRNTDDVNEVINFTIKNNKFKLSIETGLQSEITNITKKQMNETLDPDKKEWSFEIEKQTFLDIRKLANINKDESRKIIKIQADSGKVMIEESRIWEMQVDDTEQEDCDILINKDHLKFIDTDIDTIKFNMFPNFILTEGKNSKLMISFEQSFD